MSVDNVQGKFLSPTEISQLPKEQREAYVTAKRKDQKAMTIQFRQEAAQKAAGQQPVSGTVIEQGDSTKLSEEGQAAKAQANEKANQEIAEAKRYADTLYKPQELNEHERQLADEAVRAAGNEKPLYRSRKARKELERGLRERTMDAFENSQAYKDAIAKAKTDKEKEAVRELYEGLARKGAKVTARDIARGDKIEHTRVFDSRAEKWDAKDKLGDDSKDLRLRVHTARVRNADDSVVKTKMAADKNMSMHEAAHDSAKGMSGDRYYEPNEVHNFATELNTDRSPDGAAKRELQRMGYGVKDDTWKNLGKALAVGALSQVGTGAIGIAVDAFAEAMVINGITGEIFEYMDPDTGKMTRAYASDSASGTYRNWKGMGIGAAVGTAAAAALFGKTQDEDVLHGKGVDEIFTNIPGTETRAYEKLSFGSKDETLKVRTVMRAIDELDLTDAEKTQFLREAAGDKGQHILSKKELVQAFVNAYESLKPEAGQDEPPVDNTPPVDPTDPVNDDTKINQKPEFSNEVTGGEAQEKERPIETGLPHRSGELNGYVLASEGYTRADGKPLTQAQIKELINDIYTRNNVRQKGKDGQMRYIIPKTWALGNEVELKDGTVVNLKPMDELANIKAESGGKNDKVGFDKDKTQIRTETYTVYTDGGYKIYKKEPGKEAVLVAEEKVSGKSAAEIKAMAEARQKEFEEAEAAKPKE